MTESIESGVVHDGEAGAKADKMAFDVPLGRDPAL